MRTITSDVQTFVGKTYALLNFNRMASVPAISSGVAMLSIPLTVFTIPQ